MGLQGTEIPLSEVIGAFSFALDMTEGEPPGHATRSCVIGMRIAAELNLDNEARSDLFYALLLKDAGCSANAARMAALFGADDHAVKRSSKRVNWSRSLSAVLWSMRVVAPGGSLRARAGRLKAIRDEGEVTRALMKARCERGAAIVARLGFGTRAAEAVRALDEHWDGRGQPRGLRGEEIPLLGRILCLAQTVEVFLAARGVDAAMRMAERRSGGWFDPALVRALHGFEDDGAFWESVPNGDLTPWEPPVRTLLAGQSSLDGIAEAFAGIVDAKSPWTYRHSDRTCVIATSIVATMGAGEAALSDMRRAALLHDVGKLAISNRILDKPARLTKAEFEEVKRHPLLTRSILERVPYVRRLAPLASAHHERLDGSGYPLGLTGEDLSMPMRVLAVADVYEAVTSERPYRPARSSDEALAIVRAQVPHKLDAEAFSALESLLKAMASEPPPAPPEERAEAVLAPFVERRRKFRSR
jgi:HD-GYP domain-containing protein (c-di-GMP phosphodiesterase class II)